MQNKLTRPQIFLRRIQPPDVDDGYDEWSTFMWRNNPKVYKWCRQFDVLHRTGHRKWLESQSNDSTISMYMIVMVDGARSIGVCGLTSIDYINSRAEFSLYIDPEQQGQGFGEAALRALIKKGFLDYNLNCIWGEAFEDNPAIKMFMRVGFKEEGMRREFYYRNGKYVGAVLFSLLRSEYDNK